MLTQRNSIPGTNHASTLGEISSMKNDPKPKLRLANKSVEDLKEARDLLTASEACVKLLGGMMEPGVRARYQRIITLIHLEIAQVDAEMAGHATHSDDDSGD